jgi:hypothetical protein
MDEKELEALYKAMSEKFDIGEYDTFKTRMQTPDDRKKFYNAIGEQGFDLGDYNEYEKRLGGVKKKASSIDFGKSSLDYGNTLSQSQSPSPLPSEESSIDPTDIIGSIEEAKKLEKAGDFVVAGGTGGAAGSFVPNQESIKKSKDIISNIKKQGYNDEDVKSLYDDFKDFPKEAHDLQITRADGTINTPYNKSSLLDLRRTNPLRYKQLIGTIKNEFDIINVAGIREGNNYNRLNQADSLQEYYGNKQKQIGMINTYLAGEKKDKALARLYENSSSTINTANPELIQEYDKSEFKDSLDPNQFAGLETLRIFKPNQYKQAINILKTKITPQYDININPSEMGVAPPVPGGGLPTTYQTTDKSKGGKLAQETISQQVGQEEIKRALTDIGRNNAMMFAKKQMDGINSVYDDATPEEKIALQQEYIKHNYTIANAQEDAKKDIERFPLTSQMQFDQQVKEYTQKEMGAFGYGTLKFLQGFKKTGDTIENLATELFGSDDDKTLLQVKRIGELKRDQNEMYLPENLKMEGSPVIPKFSKELQGKADEILGNKDLSEYEKDSQLATLFKNNQDKIDYVTNPDAGKHKNFWSKANLYENSGMIGDIGSLVAQSMGLGMLGAGKIVTSALPMFTTAQSDYYREAVANGEPNPMAYANLHATIMAAAGLINPKLDIVKKAVGMNTALGKTLAGVSEATWDKVVKGNKPLIDKMINSAVTVGKEAGKMGAVYGFGTSVANDVADKMFFDKPITSDEIINNAVKATKHLMYSSAGLFGLTALTNFKSVSPMEKARLWELGDNKEIAIKEIEEAVLKGEITPQQGEARKKITKDVSGIIDKIPVENSKGKLLTDRQRLDYFYNDLIKNKANEAKSNLPTSQAEKAENTALVADFKNDYILEPKTDKQLESRKSQLEKSLEPKKDAEGKTIEPNEKEVKESKAELEAINDIIENKPKEEVDTKLSEPIEGLDEQGIPLGDNVPKPTQEQPKTGSVGVGGEAGIRKNKQLEKINETNPAPNDYNTWIRKVEDIKTAEEAFKVAKDEGAMYPDFTEEQMQEALDSGEVTVYSSMPIKDGIFVSPSKMNAQEYSGGKGGKLYSKKVKLDDVAWIDEGEGQYASVKSAEQSLSTNLKIEGIDQATGIPEGDNVPPPTSIEIKEELNNNDLSPRAQGILGNSIKEYNSADESTKKEMLAKVKNQLDIDQKGQSIIGMGLDADMVAAGRAFIKEIEQPIPLKNEAKAEFPKNTIQAESEGAVNAKAGEVEQPAKEGGQKPPIEPPKGGDKPMSDGEGGGDKKGLDKMAANIPNQGVIREYMSKDTIEKYTNETPQNNQEIIKQELLPALLHGEKVIEKSKEVFGDEYVEKLLDYVGKENLPIPNKALIYISLENALAKEKLESPNVERINKLQKLVYEKSQAFSRENSLALNMARLRKIAEVGYDTNKITDSFFSSKELEKKSNIEKSLEADADTINKEAEIKEVENEQVNLDRNAQIEKMVEEGVAKEIDKIYKELPTERRKKADKAIAALESIQKKLRGKLYDAGLGVPVAIIDAGITTIKNALKAGVEIVDAIELGIKKIKEKYGKKWEKEDEFRQDYLKGYEERKIDVKQNDKSIQQTVKEALIDAGFNRTTTIKGEKRKILDWKKLAGEEGSIDKVKSNVEKALLDKGMSKEEVQKMQGELIEEYNKLRASIIEKSMNELAKRNKESVSPEQKGAAKKLAELYNYGLFEKDTAEYDKLINTAIGSSVSPQGFERAKKIAAAMQTLYASTFKGVKLNDISSKAAIQQLENNLRVLLSKEAKTQGTTNFKLANIVRNFTDITQTMVLNNLKQALENPFSGLQQNAMEVISGATSKAGIGNKEMALHRTKMMRTVYKDMLVNGGIGYGDVSNKFTNRGKLDDYVNKLSDNQLYHGIASALTGKATLDAMDSMFKSSITEKKFATNLIKILTDKTNPNKISKDEAVKFVSEKLTGQTFKDAQVAAKEVIEKINKDAGDELIPNNTTSIDRLANDIVKSALEMGQKLTAEQINAAYKAAYKAAGEGLGHEANNWVSEQISKVSSRIEQDLENAIKEKDWQKASFLTYESIFFRNIANPFVGGGTNWLVLTLETTGLGLFTGLYYKRKYSKDGRIDMSSEEGMRNLEKSLYNQALYKDKLMRGAIGGGASLLTYLAFQGIANTEDYRKWRAKNKWAKRYLDTFTPEYLLTEMAAKDDKLVDYATGLMNKNESFDASTKILKGIAYGAKGDKDKMLGSFGEAVGSKFNFPVPWRLVKDGQVLYQGITGKDPYSGDFSPSIGFWNGVFKGGSIEWLGLRPKFDEIKYEAKKKFEKEQAEKKERDKENYGKEYDERKEEEKKKKQEKIEKDNKIKDELDKLREN